jgi:hypothetical protein
VVAASVHSSTMKDTLVVLFVFWLFAAMVAGSTFPFLIG